MNVISKNIKKAKRWARAIVSLFLIPAAFLYVYTFFPLLQSFVGVALIYNALSGICWTLRVFGVKTCER